MWLLRAALDGSSCRQIGHRTAVAVRDVPESRRLAVACTRPYCARSAHGDPPAQAPGREDGLSVVQGNSLLTGCSSICLPVPLALYCDALLGRDGCGLLGGRAALLGRCDALLGRDCFDPQHTQRGPGAVSMDTHARVVATLTCTWHVTEALLGRLVREARAAWSGVSFLRPAV